MDVNRWAIFAMAVVLISQIGLEAIDMDVTDADIHRAFAIANSSAAARARFHQHYNVPIDDATIERLEVITEFRRFVMESELQSARGNWMLARGGYDSKGRTIKTMLKDSRGQVAIRARVRLHPHHTYSTLPPFDIIVGEPSYLAINVMRTPITGSREDQVTLMGAIIEAAFNAPSIGDRTAPVRVVLDGKDLVRAEVDFSKME